MPVRHNPKAKHLIDAYVAKKKRFGTILKKLRQIIHAADPDVIEDWKWGPSFFHDGLLVNIGAFSEWATIHFFKGALIKDSKKIFTYGHDNANSRRINFADLAQVTKIEKLLITYIQRAVALNQAGIKTHQTKRVAKPMSADMKRALQRHGLMPRFNSCPPYQQRDYISWVTGAKQDTTRIKRLTQTLGELEDGDRYMGMKYKGKKP